MYVIDKSILNQANKCDRDFECLTNPTQPSCKISSCINQNIHFLEKLERSCPYNIEFGYSPICTCPVRKEIYNKYGV